jgi:hypothetical protein
MVHPNMIVSSMLADRAETVAAEMAGEAAAMAMVAMGTGTGFFTVRRFGGWKT